MKAERLGSVGIATVGIASALTVAVCVASAGARGLDCARRDSIKAVFPPAKAVGFSRRGPVQFQKARAPVWPGRCVGWWVEYKRDGPPEVQSYADVGVTLYRTNAQALMALREPLNVPTRTLANGARVRVAADGAWIVSVIGNVLIGSTSSFIRVDTKGTSDVSGPDISVRVLMKIHRTIHANVRRLN